ncbi:hypothetical protein C8R44DRAFT_867008 [Mycena epipterygia]|nr:hypothetical protein C8R44DRAFT_867008 [Mycena epipterygia]
METDHKKVVGSDFVVSGWRKRGSRLLEELTLITPVALPPVPPAPVSSPSPITEADLETYIKPLVMNSWSVRDVSLSTRALRGHPGLHRIYSFHNYTSARHFFDTVIAIIPDSYEWVGLRLDSDKPAVIYGISHTNVCFAIEVENEFAKNWTGRAENTAALMRTLPKTMEELWNIEAKEK